MQLSIIIVNFNTKNLTIACCKSLFAFLTDTILFEVIVIDNASHDGSREALRDFSLDKSNFSFIESTTNLGFAKANNIGIKMAKGKQVLLLNSDTYLTDRTILQAVDFLDKRPDLFGCGCTLLNADGSVGISYGKFPELAITFLEILTWRFGRFRAVIPTQSSQIFPIDFPCGAFFLVHRELIEKIGLLDEDFFMYSEETDWARRARKAGYRIMYFGPARVVHLGGQSSASTGKAVNQSGDKPADSKTLVYKSWRHYLKKHCSPFSITIIGLVVPLFFKMNSLIFHLLHREKARDQYRREFRAFQTGWNAQGPSTNE
jgi:GT2 family glycosyltransferase